MDIKTVCLGVLSMGDATGYEIRKQFEDGPFQYFFDASFGSIYPALNRLLEEGLVTCTNETQPGRPTKKIYSIAPAGHAALRQALRIPPAEHKLRSDFLATLFFGHLLDSAQRARAYDAYCDFYRDALKKLADIDPQGGGSGHSLVHGFGVAVYGAALDYLEHHREEFLADGASTSEVRRAIGGQ